MEKKLVLFAVAGCYINHFGYHYIKADKFPDKKCIRCGKLDTRDFIPHHVPGWFCHAGGWEAYYCDDCVITIGWNAIMDECGGLINKRLKQDEARKD